MTSGPGMGPYLSSPGGAGFIVYEPQPIEIGRSVALGISTLCGEVSILVIYIHIRVRSTVLSEWYICERILILGMDPIVPR